MSLVRMRSFDSKKLLAFVRGGDYAHPGEEDAIQLTMSRFPKDKNRTLLDIGCGQGGTAHYLQQHGWGRVTGFDLDQKAIEYAKQTYQDLSFYCGDVVNISRIINTRFDIIYMFNVFYEFPDPLLALQTLRSVAKPHGDMIIFDYIDLSNGTSQMIYSGASDKTTLPILRNSFQKMAHISGWKINEFVDLSSQYKDWGSVAKNIRRFKSGGNRLLSS